LNRTLVPDPETSPYAQKWVDDDILWFDAFKNGINEYKSPMSDVPYARVTVDIQVMD
jgi:hypothetical protein